MFKRIFYKSNANIILALIISFNLFTNVATATSVNTTNVTTNSSANKTNVTTSSVATTSSNATTSSATSTTTNTNTTKSTINTTTSATTNNAVKNNESSSTKVETSTTSNESNKTVTNVTTPNNVSNTDANKNPLTSTNVTSTKLETQNTVKTQVRTRKNLLVSDKKIELTESIINDILKTPAVDAKLKIYDFANLISKADEEKLYDTFSKYIAKTNIDIILVTSNDNNRTSTGNYYAWTKYANDFFDYNDFGIGASRDGILLFIDMKNRQLQISTSGKAQLYYPTGRCQNIISEISPLATKKEYLSVGTVFARSATSYFDIGIPKEYRVYDVDEYGNLVYNFVNLLIHYIPASLIVAAVAAGIFVAIGLFLSRKPKKSTNAKYYLRKDSFVLTNKIDNFVTTNTVRTKIQTNSGGSGGSGGGGRSHGGASGGF